MKSAVELEQLIAKVKVLKEEAKLYRDDSDYDEAVDVLKDAVGLLDSTELDSDQSEETTDIEKKIAWEFADCFGMLGGNYRRLNRLTDALECFKRGRMYEENPSFSINSSYNLVNAITLPIEMQLVTAEEQRLDLEQAVLVLDRQVRGNRRIDRWAWADLGQCQLLLGKFEQAAHAYSQFIQLGDADSLASHLVVIRRLRDALAGRDAAAEAAILKAINLLETQATRN